MHGKLVIKDVNPAVMIVITNIKPIMFYNKNNIGLLFINIVFFLQLYDRMEKYVINKFDG